MSSRRRKKRGSQPGPNGKTGAEEQRLTRREWLVEVGETAALLGFGGPAFAKIGPSGESHAAKAGRALPPGLYQPSLDLLTHTLEGSQPFRAVPTGTQTDYVRPPHGPFAPRFFSREEFSTVTRLVRVMLAARGGKKEGPGGGQVNQASEEISEWINLVLSRAPQVREAARNISNQHRELAIRFYGAHAIRRLESEDPQTSWREGLEWVSSQSTRRFEKPFPNLDDGEIAAILESASDGQSPPSRPGAGSRFFKLLKAAVIEGYYTSRRGLEELGSSRHGFHAESPGCPKKKRTS
jgi:Gluconate 2-dehydrogenase subunit 3